MINRHRTIAFVVLVCMLIFAGCAKHYVITQELRTPLQTKRNFIVGDITDALDPSVLPEDRPPAGDLSKFQLWLKEELDKSELFQDAPNGENTPYEVSGRIIDYKKGSGAVRFFIGFGLGNSRVIVEMSLIDRDSGETLFSGNFRREVSDWGTSGDKAFKNIAKDFAKALKKQIKNVGKFENTSRPDDSEFE